MSDQAFGFLEGSSYANAINSIVEASLEEKRQAQIQRIENNYETRIAALNKAVHEGNADIVRLDALIDADAGIFAIVDEEVALAERGLLTNNRVSGNKIYKIGLRKELGRLSQVDRELAMEGGRFSRNATQNLYDRLRSRIKEFIEYGVAQNLSFPGFGALKPSHVQETWGMVDKEVNASCHGAMTGKILLLQKAMNMLYVLSTPRQEEFKPVNLISAMGLSVERLFELAGLKYAPCQFTNPPCDIIADVANNQILEAARKDAAAFEREFEASIRANCPNAEETIDTIENMYVGNVEQRISAKRSIAKYWELEKVMKSGKGIFQLQIPDRDMEKLNQLATQSNTTTNRLLLDFIAEGVGRAETLAEFKRRGISANKKEALAFLEEVPDVAAAPGDELPEDCRR